MASEQRDPDESDDLAHADEADREADQAGDDADEPEDEGDDSDEDHEVAPAVAAAAAPASKQPEPAAPKAPAELTPSDPPRAGRLWMTAGVLVVLLVLDLVTKQWAWDNLRTGDVRTVVDGWVYYEFGFNTGSAFSFLREAEWGRALFIVVTLVALGYMARLAATLPTRWPSAYVAIALVSGGALGNLHDRIFRQMDVRGEPRHGVVDFIKVLYWPDKPWPTFNVADVALVVGVGLLFIFLTRHGETIDASKQAAVASPAPAPEA
jgi:signal peptidase II